VEQSKPATSITAAKVVEFINEIMYRFGVPNNILTDNETQFTMREFKGFCAHSGIKINYASVSHLQSNDQVEYSNGMILQGFKPRIFDSLNPDFENGLKSCHRYYGPFIPPRVMPQATRCSLWSTNPRQCYLSQWSTCHFVYNSFTKSSRTTLESMI
jgi:transposase InsO family protein